MVAFAASVVISALMVGVVIRVGKIRKPGTPLTWGEAFVAATFSFGLMLLVYAVVPHQWLLWADSELQWRKDAYFVAPGSRLHQLIRVVIPKEAVRDIIATVIYVAVLGGHIFLVSWWQKRGKAAAAAPAIETSSFGRPLVKADD